MDIAPDTFGGLAGPEIELFQQQLAGLEGTGVEIGCLDGFSTVHILEFSKLRLTSIDPLIPDSMAPNLIGREHILLENLRPYADRHTFIKGYSYDVANDWEKPLDFLFIDGSHHYLDVRRDYFDWTPFLKPQGILAIHDSRMHRPRGAGFHPGPSKLALEAVYSKPEQWQVTGEAFSLTVARKL